METSLEWSERACLDAPFPPFHIVDTSERGGDIEWPTTASYRTNFFKQPLSLTRSSNGTAWSGDARPPVNFQDNAEQRVHTVRARFFSARVMAAIAPRIADISYAHLTPSVWQATGKATIYLSWKMYVERVLAAIRAAMCYNPREFTLIKQTEENTLIYCSRF